MRRLMLGVGALATVISLTTGCYVLVDALALERGSTTRSFDAVPTVHLDVDGGDGVRVVGDGGDRIRVELRWTEGLHRASATARLDGERLIVATDCPELFNAFCSVSAVVHVPQGTAIDGGGDSPIEVVDVGGPVAVSSQDGPVRVEGARGPVRVEAGDGSIRVVDSTGGVDLATGHGSIRTERVRADVVAARTGSGSIELDLAASPDAVVARSSHGSVTVLVPDDGEPYAVSTRTGFGSAETPIRTAPNAGRSIEVASSNGNVAVRYRAGS